MKMAACVPLEIKPLDTKVYLEKRTNLPLEVSSVCPLCLVTVKKDLSKDHYLSYPAIDEPEDLYFYHDVCGQEWSHCVVLEVTLREV